MNNTNQTGWTGAYGILAVMLLYGPNEASLERQVTGHAITKCDFRGF